MEYNVGMKFVYGIKIEEQDGGFGFVHIYMHNTIFHSKQDAQREISNLRAAFPDSDYKLVTFFVQ